MAGALAEGDARRIPQLLESGRPRHNSTDSTARIWHSDVNLSRQMKMKLRFAFGAAVLLLSACATRAPVASTADRVVDNRRLVLAFHDAVARGDYAQAETMLDPDYKHYVVSAGGFKPLSWEAFKQGNSAARKAFPDWKNTPVRVVAEGTFVSLTMIGTGTHRGSLTGEPVTGRAVTLPISITHEVRDGKLVADWEVVNTEPLMRVLSAPNP
jgi:predicted ester cyclase